MRTQRKFQKFQKPEHRELLSEQIIKSETLRAFLGFCG